jgi:hypothetical protein
MTAAAFAEPVTPRAPVLLGAARAVRLLPIAREVDAYLAEVEAFAVRRARSPRTLTPREWRGEVGEVQAMVANAARSTPIWENEAAIVTALRQFLHLADEWIWADGAHVFFRGPADVARYERLLRAVAAELAAVGDPWTNWEAGARLACDDPALRVHADPEVLAACRA